MATEQAQKTVKVAVDPDKCMGHGMCAALVPSLFAVDADTGMNEMGEFKLAPERRAEALRGAAACPERAISVREPSLD
jgi:ferredoxin